MANPTPQQNQNVAPQQNMDQDVMALVKRKGKPEPVDQAKNRLKKLLKQFNIDPKKVVQAGQYAQAALKDPKLYPMAIQMAIKEGILTPDQVPKGGVSFKLLANGISAGKLAQMIIDEGGV